MNTVPLEAIVDHPLPGMSYPIKMQFAPDGRHLTFLDSEGGDLTRQLFAMDLETGARRQVVRPPAPSGEADLPLEEKLRRERLRERGLGVTRYSWSAVGERLLIPLAGGLWVQGGLDGALRELVPRGSAPAIDACFSPDGASVAYVQDAEIYTVPVDGGEPHQITSGARGTGRTHGLAEYIAQEEMKRMRGFWWSKDSQKIAFVAADETHIPIYRIVHQGSDAVGDGAQEDHRYPFAGAENARVRLGVVPVVGGEPVWMELSVDGEREDIYLAKVRWAPDGSLWAELQDRRQSRLELVRFDVETGAATTVLVETSAVWINLRGMFRFLKDGGFVWGAERTGWTHLYRYSADGALVGALTAGEWVVDDLLAVDEDGDRIYFTGNREDPRERHLYAAPLSGGAIQRLTAPGGQRSAVIDLPRGRFVELHHALDTPPTLTLRSLADGAEIRSVHTPDDPRAAPLAARAPEMVSFQTDDGATLYGALWRPEGEGPFPTLISVYGGPGPQRVQDNWTLSIDLRAQHLRERGFAIFRLDNRGSARRGLAFEGAIKWNMGDVEVRDQAAGARWLIAQGIADPDRIGVYGWSYGGYMSLMCLAKEPGLFKAAVAGAPVTHWDGYDTHYTERYMGLPAENPDGYARSSVMAQLGGMTGRLLLVHGLLDENVHFRHTARLLNALIRGRKDHRLLMFPDERHMPRGDADRLYMEAEIRDFFEDALGVG